jgi:hypothetical protein
MQRVSCNAADRLVNRRFEVSPRWRLQYLCAQVCRPFICDCCTCICNAFLSSSAAACTPTVRSMKRAWLVGRSAPPLPAACVHRVDIRPQLRRSTCEHILEAHTLFAVAQHPAEVRRVCGRSSSAIDWSSCTAFAVAKASVFLTQSSLNSRVLHCGCRRGCILRLRSRRCSALPPVQRVRARWTATARLSMATRQGCAELTSQSL